MKTLQASETVRIPEEVSISVVHKEVTVVGPRGTESRSFAKDRLEFDLAADGRTLIVRSWMSDRHMRAMVGTAAAHIRNMIVGVTAGFKLTTVTVYKHYPIHHEISANQQSMTLRNVVNNRRQRHIQMLGQTRISANPNARDSHFLIGTNIEDVTGSAARLAQNSKDDMKRDPVKFLDGIYREKLEFVDEHFQREPNERIRTTIE